MEWQTLPRVQSVGRSNTDAIMKVPKIRLSMKEIQAILKLLAQLMKILKSVAKRKEKDNGVQGNS